jgi:RNA polymerase sigma-70 factor (ECF subfamily)
MSNLLDFFQSPIPPQTGELFESVYTEFFTPIYRYVYFRVRNRDVAIDLVQNIFTKAFEKKDSLRQETVLNYLYTVARNQVIDHFRKKHSSEISDFDLLVSQTQANEKNPEQYQFSVDNYRLVQDLLESLTGIEREIITMKYVDGLENTEISVVTKKTVEAIRQVQSRALRKMYKLMNSKYSHYL